MLTLAFTLNACGDGDGDLINPSGTGSLTVTASTAGSEADPDGYTFTVDGEEKGALDGSSGVTTSGLTPGDHSVALNSVATNCEVQGDNPRVVTVSPGATALVAFNVVCNTPAADPGSLRITTSTSGPEPDPDGYFVMLDGIEPGIAVPAAGSALFPSVVVGSHNLTLSGVASHCSVVGGASTITTTVSSGAMTEVSFAVDCGGGGIPPTVGVLQVTTTTTGADQDANGYRFAVDGGATERIGANEAIDLVNTAAGVHSVVLSDVAVNCSVDEASKSVTVTAGATATVAFTITCTARPPSAGSILVTTSTGGPDQDPNGYQFSIDGGQDRAIGVDDSETVSDLAPGEYTVQLSGVAENCSVADASEEVTVAGGATASVAFEITCTALAPAVGSIRVTTTTTGPNQDADGYRFAIDEGSSRPIAVSATETVADISTGTHTVVLSGVAENCTVDDPSKNVSVTAGETSEVAFAVTCRAAGPSASRSTMLADPKSILTGESSTITVTVRDANGEPVADVPVTLESSGTGNTINPETATSNANGRVTFTFTSAVAEKKTITAVAGGVTLADTEVITVLAHGSTTAITRIAPEPSSSGQVIRVTVSVTGAGGGTPTGTVAIFSILETGGCDAAPISATGIATCEFELSEPGTHTINAVYTGDDQFAESFDSAQHEVTATAANQRATR
jgi:hypothetical protein